MSEDVPDEDEFYQRVLDHSQKRFVSDTEPVTLLDVLLETETIDNDEYRDIVELTRTSDKNREILKTIRCKGKRGYKILKKCLTESKQAHIVDHMKRREEEVKAIVKKERVQMPRKSGQISDQDLVFIAQSIGKNWELLGLALGLTNIEMYHLKCDYSSVQLQIKHMLNKWKDQVKDGDSSIIKLVSIFRTLPEVDIDFDRIKKRFNTILPIEHSAVNPGDMFSQVISKQTKSIRIQQPVESKLSRPNERNEISGQIKEEKEAQYSPQNVIDGKSYTNEGRDHTDAQLFSETRFTSPNIAEKQPMQEKGEDITVELGDSIININISPNVKAKLKDTPEGHSNIPKQQEKVDSVNPKFQSKLPGVSETNAFDELKRKSKEYKRPSYTPSRKYTHDGRLKVFKKDYFDSIKKCCNKKETISGGFGTVYLSDAKIPNFDIKVAIKEINCREENGTKSTHYINSTNNEKLASRLMHFAVVPLLGMGSDNGMFWFLCPRLDKGDLLTLIESDTKRIDGNSQGDIELNHKRRLKILYHITAAIDFLHTEIENFRGKIIHLDIKSSNFVLDEFYNARLTDFGVARETTLNKSSIHTSHTAIPITNGYFQPPTYDKLEAYFDYYNVGVVIRELLTGKPPRFNSESKELCLKNLDNSLIEYYIQEPVWEEGGKLHDSVGKLLVLSQKCIDSASSGEAFKDMKLSSREIVTECQELVKQYCKGTAWERSNSKSPDSNDNCCEMCMVNPSVASDILSHEGCNQHLKVCVTCMRNSYLNPLWCHSCFQEVKPVIGYKWGALLIPGQYDDKTLSELCQEDVKDVERVITSKWPLVMGIREKFVKRITQRPSLQNDVDTKSQIRNAIAALREEDLDTILIYYTGLYTKENGFFLESNHDETGTLHENAENQYMPLSELTKMLQLLAIRRLIVILDCPEAPLLCSIESGLSKDIDLVQLNCCKSNQEYSQDFARKGFFKRAFIQGLTMTSTQQVCSLQDQHGSKCDICPFDDEDFITIGKLERYISRHMKALKEAIEPVHYGSEGGLIGYLVHTNDKLNFTFTYNGMEKDCTISCNFFNNISQLKEVLFDEFMAKMKIDKEMGGLLQLKANTYSDILRLFIKTGPKNNHKQELFKLEKVFSAWNGKRDLFVEMREIADIGNGMVGVFRTDDNEKYFTYVNDWKHDEFMATNQYIYKIDISSFFKQKKTNPDQLHLALLTYKNPNAELHITTPMSKDELSVYARREDFLCFKMVPLQ